MKLILIDDEPNAIDVLKILIEQNFGNQCQIIQSYTDSREAIKGIINYQPDLVLLDIEMPFVNGFQVIEATKEVQYQTIFTTAYNQFAIKAFKVSAVDYLLKPIDENELIEAIQKSINQFNKNETRSYEKLVQYMQKSNSIDKVGLPIGDTIQFFNPNDILRLESDSNYTDIYLLNGKKITTAKTLKEVEEKLEGLSFYRIHHSHLINTKHIQCYIKGNAGYLKMTDDSNIPISRSKKEEFLSLFKNI